MDSQQAKISVVINTKNEEVNLPRLLKSIHNWVDEIIVCDMYSVDNTVNIAKKFGCKIIMHEDVGYVEPARKLAVESTRNSWVLMLDADELVNSDLRKWILSNFDNPQDLPFDGVEIQWIQYMSGTSIKYSDFGRHKHLRLFRKSMYQFSDKIHSRRVPIGKPKTISLPQSEGGVLHFNCGSFKRFLDKINHYAYIEAGEIVKERGTYKFSFSKGVYAFLAKFLNVYIKNKGYKDGIQGLHISICMGLYHFLVRSYAYEISNVGPENSIQEIYDYIGKNNI